MDNYVEKTVKFVYVHWVGESVPFSKKGKFGVVHGSVKEHFQVFSVVIYVWLFKTSHVHTWCMFGMANVDLIGYELPLSNAQCVTWWHRLKLQRSWVVNHLFICLFIYSLICCCPELFMIISALDACKWQPCKGNLLNHYTCTFVHYCLYIQCCTVSDKLIVHHDFIIAQSLHHWDVTQVRCDRRGDDESYFRHKVTFHTKTNRLPRSP